MSKFLLITPPFTQLNTPYPATCFLTGYLKSQNIACVQRDLGIDTIDRIYSHDGLSMIFDAASNLIGSQSANIKRIYAQRNAYLQTIDSVISFLRNNDLTIAHRICRNNFLPKASRFNQLIDMEYAFGYLGINDQARYLATLYLEDIGDFVAHTITPYFEFCRYAESISVFARSFDDIYCAVEQSPNLIDRFMLDILDDYISTEMPNIVGLSVPFPGNLYGALRCGKHIKQNYPNIKVVMGGGYPNTELRQLRESRVFQFVDLINIDKGEEGLPLIAKYVDGKICVDDLYNTFYCENDNVKMSIGRADFVPHSATGIPDYEGLPLNKYISVLDVANPMHRLWSDGRWNKMMMAHGCYWHRCSFCDTSLDYIKNYDPMCAKALCDRVEAVIRQTNQRGFHFVDEAAPPALMRDFAIEIIRRGISISWWANIRFEKFFTNDVCKLLARSGCIGVSGGLEVASDRLLKLMNKGVSLEQVSRVTNNFATNEIMVHAYLMYGFPTETAQETIDSLEVVRQLFEAGCLQSAFWHQFTMTVHSPVGQNPEQFSVRRIKEDDGLFANNDVLHEDPKGCRHAQFSDGLKKATYNFMHNNGFDFRLCDWFDFRTPRTTIARNLVQTFIDTDLFIPKPTMQTLWFDELPEFSIKKGKCQLRFQSRDSEMTITESEEILHWLNDVIAKIHEQPMSFADFEASFPLDSQLFQCFINNKSWRKLRDFGLIII